MDRIGKTRTFLTEFIIVILFFSLSIVVTLQLFLESHNQSELSKDTTIAYIKVQNIAEEIKIHSDKLEEFLTLGNGWVKNEVDDGESYRRFYNNDWIISTEQDAAYIMIAKLQYENQDSGKLLQIELMVDEQVNIYETEESLSNIVLKTYIPYEEDAL